MRTVIRLQNHGCRSHPYWWIVVMGSYTNPKGRFIEHIGYYIPRKGATVQRSVVINKPRALYWLAVGAQPSSSVHRMLSYIDYMPKPMPPFGFKQTYEKAPKEYKKPENPIAKSYGALASQYDKIREREELNLLERELLAQGEIDKQAGLLQQEDADIDIEKIDSDIEDDVKRTNTFSVLRRKFHEMEQDVSKLNVRKRELLFRKMNKLAERGLLGPEELKQRSLNTDKEPSLYGTNNRDLLEKQAKFAKLLELKKKQFEKVTHDVEMMKPITPDEHTNFLVDHLDIPYNKAKRETEESFKIAKARGVPISKHDVAMHAEKIVKKFSIADINKIEPEKNMYIPRHTVTPFPDMNTYDPQNLYDTKLGPLNLENPNKAYDSFKYNVNEPKQTTALWRRKQNKGRKTKVRMNFGTLNTPLAAENNLTEAYAEMMRNIKVSFN